VTSPVSADSSRTIATASPTAGALPRLGFLGAGWIGRSRMEAIAAAGVGAVSAVADPSSEAVGHVTSSMPNALAVDTLDGLLALDLDGIVIATPSALHASQSIAALERGVAVFCQKPLARTAAETRRVLDAARAADRPLGVDLSYRHTSGMQAIADLVRDGSLGDVYAADLTFHNAYGPDKAWFYDVTLSGGGCLIDLGVHLVDLALWTLDFPRVLDVRGELYAGGRRLAGQTGTVEDFAHVTLTLDGGATVRVACSWNVHAGTDAIIDATFYGTRGGAGMRNVDGSFYDFTAVRFDGTRRTTLATPPDGWGGRAAVAWCRRLAAGSGFDDDSERLFDVADVLDRAYADGGSSAERRAPGSAT
jgi:predicted dehydrogenase